MLEVTPDNKLKRLIVVGDRVLIKPKNPVDQTSSGLYLPATVTEKEQVQSGYVIKVGPGYPIPSPVE
ncbi:MAG: co-chaperone GroES, partial [Runella zeae]